MDNKLAVELEKNAAAGIKKCLARFSAASGAAWRLESSSSLKPGAGLLEGRAGAAVHIWASARSRFSTVMLYRPEDSSLLAECFLGGLIVPPESDTLTETLLLELGNILLNGALNSLFNAAKRSAVPSVPEYYETVRDLARGLEKCLEPGMQYLVIACAFVIEKGGREARGEVLVFLPQSAATALRKIGDWPPVRPV
jgi:hypothetical protein